MGLQTAAALICRKAVVASRSKHSPSTAQLQSVAPVSVRVRIKKILLME